VSNNRQNGIVKFFNGQKGYGFITPDGGGSDLFVHASNIEGGGANLREGSRVEFTEGQGRKGPEAIEVVSLD
jgi:cold shock protein